MVIDSLIITWLIGFYNSVLRITGTKIEYTVPDLSQIVAFVSRNDYNRAYERTDSQAEHPKLNQVSC
jgi:hypothetical protein